MKNLSYLNKFFYRYKGKLILGILFIVISNLFNILHPIVVKQAIDHLEKMVDVLPEMDTGVQEMTISPPPMIATIKDAIGMDGGNYVVSGREGVLDSVMTIGLLLAGLYVLISLLKGVFLFFTRQTIIVMSRHIEYDLKNEVYEQYQALSRSFYKRNKTGDLMNRISEDVGKVRMYLGPAVMYTFNMGVLFILAISSMIAISPELTMYTLAPLPIMSIIIYYVSTIINKRSEKVQEQQSNLSSFVQESFSGIRILKAYCRSTGFSKMFAEESELYKERQLELVKVNALFMPTIILLIGISTLLSIYMGGRMIIQGTNGFTFGDMVAFVIYVNMLTWPFAAVGWVTSLVQRASASQRRINEFLLEEPEIISGDVAISGLTDSIAFEHVNFTYSESGTKALKDVSFTIKKGGSLALFGRTGSGKSTVVDLLTRQFDPTDGQVLVDGKSLATYDIDDLRKLIGYVPQDVFLFSDTIKENISFGLNKEATQSEIDAAAEMASVKGEIISFPDKYETLLGEWGISLSGGQKQRVSIARALIRRPDILIFDDSLSAVDTETEDAILTGMNDIMKEVTTIVISHRVSTVARAQQILVFDEGRIVQTGTHAELLEQDGFYADMHLKQSLESQMA